MTTSVLFEKLVGKWTGTCKTWFEPDKLADESDVQGVYSLVLGDRFLRHVYSGSMLGKPRAGEELITENKVTKQMQVTWVDDFHMNYAIMISEGPVLDTLGYRVRGDYDVADGQPKWGWKTELAWLPDDTLRISAYNIWPEGKEDRAMETIYRRT